MSQLKESWWARCWGMLKGKLQQLLNHPWRGCMIVGAAVIVAIIFASSIYAPNISEAIVSVLTLLIALYGLYLLERRMKATEQQTQAITEQTKNTTKQTADTAKQIEESRFAKAFEQIGDRNIAIRLGGLNLLDIMAKEGEEEYQRVWGYLASFLCHPPPLGDSESDGPVGLRPDIAEITKMLRQGHNRYPDHNAQLLNLSETNLEGADLSGANLEGALFFGTNLEGANLFGANLEGAWLFGAYLEGANLSGVNIKWALLSRTNLKGADFSKANLKGADLRAASFKKTNVSGCDFSQVENLTAEQLQGMVWVKGKEAPKLPDNLSHQTIHFITKEEWRKIQKEYNR